jgi:disulfide bond formation protein DsbB
MTTFLNLYANQIIGFAVLVSNIIFAILGVMFIVSIAWRGKVYAFIHSHIIKVVFWSALIASVGSLIYSNIIGFPPCDLCWWQRILLYPQVLISGIALWKKDKSIIEYIFPMSIAGAIIALYQSSVQWGLLTNSILNCAAVGGECAKVYVNEFGYITIPFMSFSIFVYLIVLKLIFYKARKIHG